MCCFSCLPNTSSIQSRMEMNGSLCVFDCFAFRCMSRVCFGRHRLVSSMVLCGPQENSTAFTNSFALLLHTHYCCAHSLLLSRLFSTCQLLRLRPTLLKRSQLNHTAIASCCCAFGSLLLGPSSVAEDKYQNVSLTSC